MERLDKMLANTGLWSRREVRELVRTGRVTVDGVRAAKAEDKVGESSEVLVDGKPVTAEKTVWIMLHKPAGVVSATEDRREDTVLSLLPQRYQKLGLFPVGRLDKDTEGLLLLTNDGAAAHGLLAPKKHVDKVYFARVDGTLTGEDADAFREGIRLRDGTECLEAELNILAPDQALVTIHEGKYHQVKRMLASRGKPVVYLKRMKFGALELDPALGPGQWRELTENERKALVRADLSE